MTFERYLPSPGRFQADMYHHTDPVNMTWRRRGIYIGSKFGIRSQL
jgi:hypothetical protein